MNATTATRKPISEKTKSTLKRYGFVISIMIIPLISFFVFYVYVNASSFVLAFQRIDEVTGRKEFYGLNNFKKLFESFKPSDDPFNDELLAGISILNSLKMWWINFLICMPLYLIFSYYIYKKFAGGKSFRVIAMLPSIVSTFVYALVYKKFVDNPGPFVDILVSWGFDNFKEINIIAQGKYAWGNNIFFTIWLSFGTSLLVFTNAMNAIDQETLESARLDGVNDRQEFTHIILPMIWPTLSTMIVTGATGMFTTSGSMMTFYMTTPPSNSICGFQYYLTIIIKKDVSSYSGYPLVAASGLFVMIITLPVVYLAKWLLEKMDKMGDAV